MKFLKYISICLLAVIAASCSKEDIKYPIEDVDPSQAQIQVAYMCPKAAITANYIYTVVINGQKYSNNGSSFLATYNYVPSASAGLFYVVKAGEVSIQFLDKDNKEVYNQKVTVAEGSRQMVVVYDFAKAPAVVPTKEPLKFPGVSATGDKCSVRLYNFLFESEGVPMTDKIQYGIQNIETKVYEPVGTPIAFGEATDFIPVNIDKEGPGGSGFNTAGSQRRDVCFFRIDGQTGENKGQLQFTNAKGKVGTFTDYWNWAIGRGYLNFARGVLDSKTYVVAIKQFVAN